MAVVTSTGWRVEPGRGAEFVSGAAEAKAIHERLGAQIAMVQWNSAGTLSGTFTYALSVPDFAAWGNYLDQSSGDAEWQAWIAKYGGADAPASPISQITAIDRPGFDEPDSVAPGAAVLALQCRVAAGSAPADLATLFAEQREVAVRLGANWHRLLYAGMAGEFTGRSTALIGFDSPSHYGEWQENYLADSAGVANNQALTALGSPVADLALMFGRIVTI